MQSPKRKQKGVRASNTAPLNGEIQEADIFALMEGNILISDKWRVYQYSCGVKELVMTYNNYAMNSESQYSPRNRYR